MRHLSAQEAADLYGRSLPMMQDFCRRGLVPGAYKSGGHWKIPESDVPPQLPRKGKLTEEQRREIARLGHENSNRSKLARDYEITRTHVYHLMGEYPPGEST